MFEKKNYTQAKFYSVNYECFDLEKKRYIDEFVVGYFVSEEEARKYLKEEILDQHACKIGKFWASFEDERDDVPWKHCYKIHELLCGRAVPDWSISRTVVLT